MVVLSATRLRWGSMLAIIAAGSAATLGAVPACSGAKCGGTDVDCFLDNIVIAPPTDGAKPMRLVSLPATKLSANKADGGADAGPTAKAPTPVCPAGRAFCGASCVDIRSDPNNCGGCGARCPSGQPCVDSACGGCPPGDAWCPATGCTFTGGDEKNCGGCGRACDPRQICDNAICQCRGDNPRCLDGPPPGGAPSITNTPEPLRVPDGKTLQPIELDFQDPNQCQPAFCAHLCRGTHCTTRYACVPPVNDHLTGGVWRSYLGFLAESDDSGEMTMGVVPLSAPGCPADLVEQVAAGTLTPDVGTEVEIEVTITGQGPPSSSSSSSSSSGSTPSGGTFCSPATATCSCSLRACTDNTRCWYQTSKGIFNCASCGAGCNPAAQSAVNACCPH